MNIITKIPLTPNDAAVQGLGATRVRSVTAEEIARLLKNDDVEFFVANIGEPLITIAAEERYKFWKAELKPHLAAAVDQIFLEDYPDGYCYLASEWRSTDGSTVIIAGKYH